MDITKISRLLQEYNAARQAAREALRRDDDDNFAEPKNIRQAATEAKNAAAAAYNAELDRLISSGLDQAEAKQLQEFHLRAGIVS